MADIQSIDMRNGEIIINLKVSEKEYALLRQETKNLLLLPTSDDVLDETLTTGKLGNSNRIMLPKKNLERHRVIGLLKKTPSKIFRAGDKVFLLVKLNEKKFGVPVFKEETG